MTSDVLPPDTPERAAAQRHTVRALAVTNAVGGVGVTTGITVATLLAADVSGRESLAGLSQTAQVAGAALWAFVLSRVMTARGRRVGLVIGYAIGTTGALLCVLAGVLRSFPLLLAAALLVGAAGAANSQSRFAATDLATEEHRGRDLSLVVWATTVGAVTGPNLAGLGGSLAIRLGLPPLTGAFLLTALALLVTIALVHLLLRPDPLLAARAAARRDPDRLAPEVSAWEVVRTRPTVAACVVAIALAQAVMVGVMIMTPIHMRHGAASVQVIGLTISGHILGMYAFSPLVGRLVDRWGAWRVMLLGAAVEAASVALAAITHAGASWLLSLALFGLGIGWALAMIGASSSLVGATPLLARAPVQGLSDLCMGLTAAVGGALAGVIVGSLGYPVLALSCLPACLVVAACALRVRHLGGPDRSGAGSPR
ncbi:MFS transporter [Arsenicicoccus dermatophilus]|uniref:MFS transporter n=1 Tax=Arsenicicoccus dermatophilus TaxID=1076331 RepID=UPI0039175DFE